MNLERHLFPVLQTEPINASADVRPIPTRTPFQLAPPPTEEPHPYYVSRYFAEHGELPPWGSQSRKYL